VILHTPKQKSHLAFCTSVAIVSTAIAVHVTGADESNKSCLKL